MSGLIKLGVAAVLIFGIFGIWRYVTAPTDSGSVSGGALLDLTDKDWVRGASDAPVTLIEYTDFQCPACGAYYPIIEQLSKEFEGKLKFVVRHYPLMQIHPNALGAARAAEAAGRQEKFWDMYHLLYTNQNEWSVASDPMKSMFPAYASQIGLDVERFRQDMTDATLDDKITNDRKTGNELEITGTPSFFLNGKKLESPRSLEEFQQVIKAAIK
ncbi:MAG: thioredoxin domain-containing protein [Candidatus Moranbacteria bacterium]|nr:thioredoxin domain-containing protein [Candidatus Moranbacteria bacterium]